MLPTCWGAVASQATCASAPTPEDDAARALRVGQGRGEITERPQRGDGGVGSDAALLRGVGEQMDHM